MSALVHHRSAALRLIPLLAVVALLASACGDEDPTVATASADDAPTVVETPAAAAEGSEEALDPFLGDESGPATLTITDLDFNELESPRARACRTGVEGYETYLVTTDGDTRLQLSFIPLDEVATTVDAALELDGELFQVASYGDTSYAREGGVISGESYLTNQAGTTVIVQWEIDEANGADCGGLGGELNESPGLGLDDVDDGAPAASLGYLTLNDQPYDVVGGCRLVEDDVETIVVDLVDPAGGRGEARLTQVFATEETSVTVTEPDGFASGGTSPAGDLVVSEGGLFEGTTVVYGPSGGEVTLEVSIELGPLTTC